MRLIIAKVLTGTIKSQSGPNLFWGPFFNRLNLSHNFKDHIPYSLSWHSYLTSSKQIPQIRMSTFFDEADTSLEAYI